MATEAYTSTMKPHVIFKHGVFANVFVFFLKYHIIPFLLVNFTNIHENMFSVFGNIFFFDTMMKSSFCYVFELTTATAHYYWIYQTKSY